MTDVTVTRLFLVVTSALLGTLDAVQTYYALSTGYFIEVNPVAATIGASSLPLMLLVGFMATMVIGLVGVVVVGIRRWYGTVLFVVVLLLLAVKVLVVLSNQVQLLVH